MADVQQNILPQADILNSEENSAIDAGRLKAPVDGVDPTDIFFGWGEKPVSTNQAGTEEVDRLVVTVSQKMNEEDEVN